MMGCPQAIELRSAGLGGYFSDMWNVMDWANFLVFYLVWWRIQTVFDAIALSPQVSPCTNYLCSQVGYFDDWQVMAAMRQTKLFLSLCVCIQVCHSDPAYA